MLTVFKFKFLTLKFYLRDKTCTQIAMDVVCLSSDSENSTVPNDIQMQFQSEAMNMDDDVFLVDWNDEFHPAVNYVSQPGNAEVILLISEN